MDNRFRFRMEMRLPRLQVKHASLVYGPVITCTGIREAWTGIEIPVQEEGQSHSISTIQKSFKEVASTLVGERDRPGRNHKSPQQTPRLSLGGDLLVDIEKRGRVY